MAQYKNIDIVPDETVNRIHLSQGDIGRTLIFYLFENALSWSVPASSTIKCQGTKPSGFGFSVSCTYSGNTVTCVTTDEMTDEFGQIEAELVITSSDESQIFGTSNFILDIEKNPHPDNTTDGNAETAIALTARITALESAVGDIDDLETAANNLVEAINEVANHSAGGQPVAVTLASDMTDPDTIYLYLGNEEGYDYGYLYVYLSDEWTKTNLYGKGQDGTSGADGYSPTATVTQTQTGATISITDENGTTSASVTNGTATDAQVETYVDAWLDEHPDATTTVTDGSITEQKLASDVLAKLNSSKDDDINLAYMYPTYTATALNNDGTTSSSAIAYTTDFLPVEQGETLKLCSALTSKVAYYNSSKTLIGSLVSVSTGTTTYTVPSNAVYARFENVLQGAVSPFTVREKSTPSNESFFDLIMSPLKSAPTICITGDSNTIGYGLDNSSMSWANLFMNALVSDITLIKYNTQSRFVEAFGGCKYSTSSYNYKKYSQMSIWTDATSVTLNIATSYSSAYKWYVDGTHQTTFDSTATLTGLDGNLHKVTVEFTNGQSVNPWFSITKSITYTNKAVSGVSSDGMTWDTGKDWLIVMIGTNNRAINPANVSVNFNEYWGRGTYVCPFPNNKSDNSYTYSQMYSYANLERCFKDAGFDILRTDAYASEFYSSTLYQGDLIHFNAIGHRKIANIVSALMGFPLCLKEA